MSYRHLSYLTTGQVLTYINTICHYYPALLRSDISGAGRLARGASLARAKILHSEDLPGCFDVQSQVDRHTKYTVDPNAKSCTCPDSRAGYICKHRIALAIHQQGPDLSWRLMNDYMQDPDERTAIETGRYIPYDRDGYDNPVIPGEPVDATPPTRVYVGNDPEIIAQERAAMIEEDAPIYEVFVKPNGKLIPVKLLEMWTNHDGSRYVAVESVNDDHAFEGPNKPGQQRISIGTVRATDLIIVKVCQG